jgi:hypothetical protein
MSYRKSGSEPPLALFILAIGTAVICITAWALWWSFPL